MQLLLPSLLLVLPSNFCFLSQQSLSFLSSLTKNLKKKLYMHLTLLNIFFKFCRWIKVKQLSRIITSLQNFRFVSTKRK